MTLVLSPFFRNAALGNADHLWYHDANRRESLSQSTARRKKDMKKLLALALTLMMVLSLGGAALAEKTEVNI